MSRFCRNTSRTLALQMIADSPGGSLRDRHTPFDQALKVTLEGAPVESVTYVPSSCPVHRRRERLPASSNGILRDQRVRCQQQAIMFNCLADEHAIKRVSMQDRKFGQMEDGSFIERKCRNPMSFPLLYDETVDRARQRQLTKSMLHGKFPDGHRAEQHFVGGIREDLLRSRRQFFGPSDDPQERACVEQAPHPCAPSNASSSSSGRGSKKERGTENRPLARPIGRG